jgi:hypothetical protein
MPPPENGHLMITEIQGLCGPTRHDKSDRKNPRVDGKHCRGPRAVILKLLVVYVAFSSLCWTRRKASSSGGGSDHECNQLQVGARRIWSLWSHARHRYITYTIADTAV